MAVTIIRPSTSHPVRVRGLKQSSFRGSLVAGGSHPVRVRGLKLRECACAEDVPDVAPRAGAWIETL